LSRFALKGGIVSEDFEMPPHRGLVDDTNESSWDEARQHVFAELRRLSANGHDDRNSLQATKLELAVLTAKIAVWGVVMGVVFGTVSGVISSLIVFWTTKK
jgi:hypothetical protein